VVGVRAVLAAHVAALMGADALAPMEDLDGSRGDPSAIRVAHDGSSPAVVATDRRPSFFGRLARLAGALPTMRTSSSIGSRSHGGSSRSLDFATMRLASSAMRLVSSRNQRSHLNMPSPDAA
jgi:hypothetical protein